MQSCAEICLRLVGVWCRLMVKFNAVTSLTCHDESTEWYTTTEEKTGTDTVSRVVQYCICFGVFTKKKAESSKNSLDFAGSNDRWGCKSMGGHKFICCFGVCYSSESMLRVYGRVFSSVFLLSVYLCVRMPSSPSSIAGVPSSRALSGFPIIAPPPVCVPAVIGALAAWWYNNKKKIKCQPQHYWVCFRHHQWGRTNFGPAQTTEPPGHKLLVVNVVVVGPFEEEEEGTGVTSDVVKVKGEDLATSGPLKRNDLDPGTVTIPQYRVNKTKQHTPSRLCLHKPLYCALDWLIIAFITWNSNLVPSLDGLCICVDLSSRFFLQWLSWCFTTQETKKESGIWRPMKCSVFRPNHRFWRTKKWQRTVNTTIFLGMCHKLSLLRVHDMSGYTVTLSTAINLVCQNSFPKL